VDAHAHVQRLVSVVKMATVLEEYTKEEQRYVVRYFLSKRTQYKGYSLGNMWHRFADDEEVQTEV
jgi:hypothetical protein